MLARAEKYARAEEAMKARRDASKSKRDGKGKHKKENQRRSRSPSPKRRPSPVKESRRPRSPPRKFGHYTPLVKPRTEILMEIDGRGYLRSPAPLKPAKRNRNKYCRYHRDVGHDTEDCRHLRDEIEALIRRGHLARYVQPAAVAEEKQPVPAEQHENRPTAGVINMISGDSGTMLKKATTWPEDHHQNKPKRHRTEEIITFSEQDLGDVQVPHDDAVVVSLTIANYDVKRILVDNGSSANVLFYETFQRMRIPPERLGGMNAPLVGFTGDSVETQGTINLLATIGTEPRHLTRELGFLVVKVASPYNAILGRPGLNAFRAVVSTYHLLVRFPTGQGVGEARGDQQAARQCYTTALRHQVPINNRAPGQLTNGSPPADRMPVREEPPNQGQTAPKSPDREALDRSSVEAAPSIGGEDLDMRDELQQQRGAPAETLEQIALSEESPERTVQIGSSLDTHTRADLIAFLKANSDVFAWTATDIPGISPEVITHKLSLRPGFHPIRQKKRNFATEKQAIVDQEVAKLLEAKFIREVNYPDWLANVVLVKKANGKWRICIDYTDLNKACPKDSYPLPRIDQLVDATSGHKMLTFMDAFSGYNQIQMATEDQEKTSFITSRGLFCYQVMPFGLKNAGATYQRLVNKVFKDQIGRNVEVYVDDMLVKSQESDRHITDLKETFETLRRFRIKLNPTKCAFGVSAGKFLGFLITQRGIEANPQKIQAIQEMQPPRTVKEVQRLTGRIAALSRFLSRSAERCLPFFKVLRNPKDFRWTDDCQAAFDDLKEYLKAMPLLTKPQPGETHLLYLAISPQAVSSVLLREEDGRQRPIYYVSKVLRGAETRYPQLEKTAFALVVTARKLRPYFQSHTIAVLTDQPIRQVLQKPDHAGRLAKWAVELGEFDIEYRPRPSVKGQALADFMVECTIPQEERELQTTDQGFHPWTLHVDGSSNKTGSGAGLILTSPEGFVAEYALRFEFPASNNEAEYEALITGLRIASELGVKQLKAFSDSQLVVGQTLGEFQTRESNMTKYQQKVKQVSSGFDYFEIQQIPRAENARADLLSRLATVEAAKLTKPTYLQILETPSIQEPNEVMCLASEPCWMDPLVEFLQQGKLPVNKTQARKIRRQAARYLLIGNQLYRRSYTQPLLKCLRPAEGNYALREIHEGLCGGHLGGRALALKTMRQGYYWPTLMHDAVDYVKRCDKCQRYGVIQRRPSTELTPMGAPWPFAQWGIDILGPFPLATGQRKFLFVAVDYFTKWVEAEAVARITDTKAKNFVQKFIVARFGIPRVLVTDNGRQFDSENFDEFCSDLGIQHRYTSVAHPQTNGEAEVTNRSILKGLKTRLNQTKSLWVEELDNVLWAYRTTQRTPTGETPFNLTYGTEAVLPVELGLPSARVQHFNPAENDEQLRANLDLLEETREQARLNMLAYQRKVARYHNARVRGKHFQPADLVLRRVEASRVGELGKLGPNWEGPYKVIEVVRPGTYKLARLDDTLVPRTWNSEHLRMYYQ